jgi:hypothetical protein
VVSSGDINEEKAGDLYDRVEATAKDEKKRSNIQTIFEKNLSNINKIDELHNMTRNLEKEDIYKTPQKKKSSTAKELKETINEYNQLNPENKMSTTGNKAKLVEKVNRIINLM